MSSFASGETTNAFAIATAPYRYLEIGREIDQGGCGGISLHRRLILMGEKEGGLLRRRRKRKRRKAQEGGGGGNNDDPIR